MTAHGGALPEIGVQIGGHRLERLLGRGGMGAVFLGRNAQGAVRAVRVPIFEGEEQDELRSRFEREARTLAALKPHRNVVGVHSAGQERGFAYCVLELVEGRDLDAIVRAEGPLPIERALAIGEEIARALEHVHAAGVIHRDLKPANSSSARRTARPSSPTSSVSTMAALADAPVRQARALVGR